MDKLVIEGGHPLTGEVFISGSKNAALPVIAATLLTDGVNTLSNVPQLVDIKTMMKLLTYFGVQAQSAGEVYTVDTRYLNSVEACYDIVRTMRASILVLGPLLARFGQARVSLPGGCAIGARPVQMHLDGLKALGASLAINSGYIDAKTPREGLKGARIVFESPSVGATQHLMTATETYYPILRVSNGKNNTATKYRKKAFSVQIQYAQTKSFLNVESFVF